MGKRITIATSNWIESKIISNVLIFDNDSRLYNVFNEDVRAAKEVRGHLLMPFKGMRVNEDVFGCPIYQTKAKHLKNALKGFETKVGFNSAIINYIMGLPNEMRVYFGMDEFALKKRKK